MDRRARRLISALQSLGKMTERVLSNPAKTVSLAPAPILDGPYDPTGKTTLLDVWQSFDPAMWTVDRLEGAIYRRNILTLEEKALSIAWKATQLPDDANFKAVVICVMRTIEKQPAIKTNKPPSYRDIIPEGYKFRAQIAELIGSNIGDLMVAFTGEVLSSQELIAFEVIG